MKKLIPNIFSKGSQDNPKERTDLNMVLATPRRKRKAPENTTRLIHTRNFTKQLRTKKELAKNRQSDELTKGTMCVPMLTRAKARELSDVLLGNNSNLPEDVSGNRLNLLLSKRIEESLSVEQPGNSEEFSETPLTKPDEYITHNGTAHLSTRSNSCLSFKPLETIKQAITSPFIFTTNTKERMDTSKILTCQPQPAGVTEFIEHVDKVKEELVDLDYKNEINITRDQKIEEFKEELVDLYENEIDEMRGEEIEKELVDLDNRIEVDKMRDGEIEVFKEELVDLNCTNGIDEIKNGEVDKFRLELVDLDKRNEVDEMRDEEIEEFKEELVDFDYENKVDEFKDEEIDKFRKELVDLDKRNEVDEMRDEEIEEFKEELVDLDYENKVDEFKDEEIDKFRKELVDLDNRNEVDKMRGEEIEGFKEELLDLDYENEIVEIKDEEIDNFKKELLDLDNSNKGDKTRDEEIEDFKEESVDLDYENKIDEIKDTQNEIFKVELVDLDNRNEGNEMRGEEIEEFKEELVDLDYENKIDEIKDEEIEIFKMELVDLDNRNEVDKMGDEEIEQFKKRLIDLDNKNEIDEMRDELIEEFDEKLVDPDDENNINKMKDKEMGDVEELERELENLDNQNDIDKIRQESVEHFEKGLTDLHVHNEIHKMTEDGEEFKKELLDLGYENKIETIGETQHAEVFQKKLVDQDFEKEEVSEGVFKDQAFIEYKIEIEGTKVERELEHVGSKNGPEDLSASTENGNIGKLVENEEEKNWIELKHIPILIQQMTQHVQILAQNFILTYNHPELHDSSAQIKEYLLNIKFLCDGKERSCFHTVNLSAALELVDYWEKLLATNNDDVKKMKLHIEETIAKCIHYHQSGTVFIVPFPALILETISNSSAIVYPSLLPKIPFKTPKVAYRVNNVVYTKSEDQYICDASIILSNKRYLLHWHSIRNTKSAALICSLAALLDPVKEPRDYVVGGLFCSSNNLISLGLEQFMPVGLVTQKGKRYCKPRGLISVCDLIQAHMMTYRESVRIRNHINVMKHKKHSSNPIKYYFEFGKAPPYVHHLIPLGPSLPPCERSPEDLPYQWREYLNSQKENQEMDSSSCNVILVVGTLIS